MRHHSRRRRGVALVAGLVACAALGAAPAHAQSVPVVVPPVVPVVVGIPPVVVGVPGVGGFHDRAGIAWSESGRADVDVDVDRHHGQAVAR